MSKKKRYVLYTIDEQTSELYRLFWALILLTSIFVLTFKPINFFTNESDQTNKDVDDILTVEEDIYFLTNIPVLEKEIPHQEITLEESVKIDKPSMFFATIDSIEEPTNELSELYNKLLDKGHLIMFVGINHTPETVEYLFDRTEIMVIPIYSQQPIAYHAFGGVYNKNYGQPIPVYYGSTDLENINFVDFKRYLNKISEEFMVKELLNNEK